MHTSLSIALLLLLAGCATATLDRLKELNARNALAAIAETRLDCLGPDDPVCVQSREIVANACLRLGTASLAPQSANAGEAAARFDCAIANYRAALAAAPRPLAEADRARLAAGLLLALRERRDQARSAAEAAPFNAALAAEAAALRQAAPRSALGAYYGASAAYAESVLGGERCAALTQARALLAAAPPPDAALAPPMQALKRRIEADLRTTQCER